MLRYSEETNTTAFSAVQEFVKVINKSSFFLQNFAGFSHMGNRMVYSVHKVQSVIL